MLLKIFSIRTTPQSAALNSACFVTGTHKFRVEPFKILCFCMKFTLGAFVFFVSTYQISPALSLFGITSSKIFSPSTKISPSSLKSCIRSNSFAFCLKSFIKSAIFSSSSTMSAFCINFDARMSEFIRSSSQI